MPLFTTPMFTTAMFDRMSAMRRRVDQIASTRRRRIA
jgi:hypothetical protein